MKTAISLPDDVYDAVTRRASDLGVSRSQFLATAARHYLGELDAAVLTRQIDDALAGEPVDESGVLAAGHARARLTGESDW
jgi:hypothetical protein